MHWGVGAMLIQIAHDTKEPPRQAGAVWRVWHELGAPLSSKSFIQMVLRGQLLVNSRYDIFTSTTTCPLCGTMETIDDFMSFCNLRAMIHDTIHQCSGAEVLSLGEEFGEAETLLPKFMGALV